MQQLQLFLGLVSGICWTIVYIDMIRKGFKEKTYGMPLFALALNLAWETIYSYKGFSTPPNEVQDWINFIWMLFDCVIVYTYFKYGRKEFSKSVKAAFFVPWSILVFALAFLLQYAFILEFDDMAIAYSAFIQNLIMSVLFISMLIKRNSTLGQSLLIAVCKWIGTLAPTLVFSIIKGNLLVTVLGIFCSVFDLIYIYLVYTFKKVHKDSTNPKIK